MLRCVNYVLTPEQTSDNSYSLTTNETENSGLIQNTGLNKDSVVSVDIEQSDLLNNKCNNFLTDPIDFPGTASNDSGIDMTKDDLFNMTF